VGFSVLNPAGVYPVAVDISAPLARRSYVSTDGSTFLLYDTLPGIRAGNFGIRARVETGSAAGGGSSGASLLPLRLTPAFLTFQASEAGVTKAVQVDNPNSQAVTITGVTSSDPSFVAVTAAPATVGPGSFVFVQIRFSPSGSGVFAGTIRVETNPASAGVTFAAAGAGGGASSKVAAVAAAAWPNGRTADNVPGNAVDGNTSTFTWTTAAFNSVNPSYLAIGFAGASAVNRIRLYKDNDSGGVGLVAKNLMIEYTTSSPSTPLAARVWQPVSGLVNGFNGAEMLVAAGVNPNGAVTADNHDSARNGWASLTFDGVQATGLRIGFSNAAPAVINHYRVYEFEAYGGSAGTAVGR
jgi:hypothetical protein